MSLISTGTVRTWLGLPEGDKDPNVKIASLINAVEAFIDNYTNRKLAYAVYTSNPEHCIYDGTGKEWIYLRQYPISYVSDVRVDSDRAWGSNSVVELDDLYYYPDGKLVSEDGYFIKGRRNIRIDYSAGYGGAGSYPIPSDLSQVITEMVVQSYKEGITAVHTVVTQEQIRMIKMLDDNSFWKTTLNMYKNYAVGLAGYDE